MNTPEGRRFAAEIAGAPVLVQMRIEGRAACGCGCGQPDRVEFTLCGRTVTITSPAMIDAAIDTLRKARRQLWGNEANDG